MVKSTIFDIFSDVVVKCGANAAIIYEECSGICSQLSFAEVKEAAVNIAKVLLCRFGINDQNRICIVSHGFPVAEVLACLACSSLGIPFVPVDIRWNASGKLKEIILNSMPDVAIVVAESDNDLVVKTLYELGIHKIVYLKPNGLISNDMEQFANTLGDNFVMEQKSDANANPSLYIMYTSGSTGVSKGVIGTVDGLLSRIRWQDSMFPWNDDPDNPDIVCRRTPLTFVDSMCEIFGSLFAGVRLFAPRQSVFSEGIVSIIRQCAENRISRITLLPSQLEKAMDQLPDLFRFDSNLESIHGQCKWKSARLIVISGESPSTSLVLRFREWVGSHSVVLLNLYGSTEVSGDVTYALLHNPRFVHPLITEIPIGVCMTGNVCVLANTVSEGNNVETLKVSVGNDEQGELWVGGIHVARGYFNNFEETKKRFLRIKTCLLNDFTSTDTNWLLTGDGIIQPASSCVSSYDNENYTLLFRTGDIVRRSSWTSSCSEYLTNSTSGETSLVWLGRCDNQIKVNGVRIELEEVEKHLLRVITSKSYSFAFLSSRGFDTVQSPKEGFIHSVAVVAVKDELNNGSVSLVAYIEAQVIEWLLLACFKNNGSLRDKEFSLLFKEFLISCEFPNDYLPTVCLLVDHIPVTTTGKVNRVELKKKIENYLNLGSTQCDFWIKLYKNIMNWTKKTLLEEISLQFNGKDEVLRSLSDLIAAYLRTNAPLEAFFDVISRLLVLLYFDSLPVASVVNFVESNPECWEFDRIFEVVKRSSFQNLGGDSMLTLTLQYKINTAFAAGYKCDVSPEKVILFSNPLEDICKLIIDKLFLNTGSKESEVVAVSGKRKYNEFYSAKDHDSVNFIFNYSVLRSPFSLPPPLFEFEKLCKLNIVDRFKLDRCVDASPLYVEYVCSGTKVGIVFVSSHSGDITAVEVNGERYSLKWRTIIGEHVESSASTNNDGSLIFLTSYVGQDIDAPMNYSETSKQKRLFKGSKGSVWALNAFTGAIQWWQEIMGEVKGTSTYCKKTDMVWVGSHDGNLYCLQGSFGVLLRTIHVGSAIFSSPLCIWSDQNYEMTVVVGTLNGTIHSYVCSFELVSSDDWLKTVQEEESLNDLNLIKRASKYYSLLNTVLNWQLSDLSPLFGTILYYSSKNVSGYVFGAVNGTVRFVLISGEVLWEINQSSSPIFCSPCFVNENSFVIGSHDGYIRCYDFLNGKLLWKSKYLGSAIYSSPFSFFQSVNSIVKNFVVCALTSGLVAILDGEDGSIVTQLSLSGEIFSSPICVSLHGNLELPRSFKLIIGSRDDHLYLMNMT